MKLDNFLCAPNLAKIFVTEVKIMAKANSIQIKLVSSADTGYYYIARKNPRTLTDKIEVRKYDPVARKHVIFKEAKIK